MAHVIRNGASGMLPTLLLGLLVAGIIMSLRIDSQAAAEQPQGRYEPSRHGMPDKGPGQWRSHSFEEPEATSIDDQGLIITTGNQANAKSGKRSFRYEMSGPQSKLTLTWRMRVIEQRGDRYAASVFIANDENLINLELGTDQIYITGGLGAASPGPDAVDDVASGAGQRARALGGDGVCQRRG